MALTTHAEIKAEIMDNLERLKDSPYPEDLLNELADGNTPIYYSDIISEWQEMPSEFNDIGRELGVSGEPQIMNLMQDDLAIYYQQQFSEIWEEVKEEQEIENAEV